ncbi:MAG TPA: hypothetical protein VF702_07700 [Allosphingosinicella sp.]|jgi:hypothetical protein
MTEADQWSQLTDAEGRPYDPRPALEAVRTGDADAGFAELWERLHHQDDLGTAAYGAAPELLDLMRSAARPDWRAYALIATVDELRHKQGNPSIPEWLTHHYLTALNGAVDTALGHLRHTDEDLAVRSILAVLAHAKGQRTLGSIALWTEDERKEALGEP